MGSATLISARIFTPTLCFQEEPPCSPESVSACPRRSPPLPLPRSRSRLSLHQSVNTLCGSEDPFLPLCLLSRVCGSARRSTTNRVPRSSTASASKLLACSKSCLFVLPIRLLIGWESCCLYVSQLVLLNFAMWRLNTLATSG